MRVVAIGTAGADGGGDRRRRGNAGEQVKGHAGLLLLLLVEVDAEDAFAEIAGRQDERRTGAASCSPMVRPPRTRFRYPSGAGLRTAA